MSYFRNLISLILIISNFVYSQELYVNPESAAYYSNTSSYFISNYSGSNIIEIDSSGNKTVFKEGLSRPCGIVICDSILYVVDNPKKVRGFKVSDGTQVLEIEIDEAKFLNDITSDDDDNLFVTDSRLNAVFKINRISKSHSLFVKTLGNGPNGIVYDSFYKRLLICYFRENSQIDKINVENAEIEKLISTNLDNLDGMTFDENGNCYISSWGLGDFKRGFKKEGTIYKVDQSFSKTPTIVKSGYFGPADIFYNENKKELIVPLYLANDLEVINIEQQ